MHTLPLSNPSQRSLAMPAEIILADASAQTFEPCSCKGIARILSERHSSSLKHAQAIRHRMFSARKHLDAASARGADGNRPLFERKEANIADFEMSSHRITLYDNGLSLGHFPHAASTCSTYSG